MDITVQIYIAGCVAAFVLVLWKLFKETDGDITVQDLFLAVLISLLFSTMSWMAFIVELFFKYGDKVVIRRRKK